MNPFKAGDVVSLNKDGKFPISVLRYLQSEVLKINRKSRITADQFNEKLPDTFVVDKVKQDQISFGPMNHWFWFGNFEKVSILKEGDRLGGKVVQKNIPVETEKIAHLSDPQFENLKNDHVMESLRDKTIKIDVPYLLAWKDKDNRKVITFNIPVLEILAILFGLLVMLCAGFLVMLCAAHLLGYNIK